MSKKQKAFKLFDQGKRPGDQEVKDLGLKSKTTFNYFQEWKKSAANQLIGTMKPKPVTVTFDKQTDAVSHATVLNLVAQTLSLPLTPDIYMSYMCAVKNGYEGAMGEWLGLVSRDFWLGRGRNFYQEVTGISEE